MFYVEIVGSLDAVRVGPFKTRAGAEAYQATVPTDRFNANVMTADESAESDRLYGALPVQAPTYVEWES